VRGAVAPIRAEAELVLRQLTSGKSHPLVVSARLPSDEVVECVVKLRSRIATAPTEYLLEWVAASLARSLGIKTPDSFEVAIGSDFVEAIDDSKIKTDAATSVGSVYGSRFLPAHAQWVGEKLHPDMRAAAGDLLAFDVCIHNVDRRTGNANVLVNPDLLT
jgi:hypothetical protein